DDPRVSRRAGEGVTRHSRKRRDRRADPAGLPTRQVRPTAASAGRGGRLRRPLGQVVVGRGPALPRRRRTAILAGVPPASTASFCALIPDRVLAAVEVGGLRSTGRCQPLRAFENRVYDVELDDGRRLVVKFYRPGRWSRETILEEHAFLADLVEAEVPAVAPI